MSGKKLHDMIKRIFYCSCLLFLIFYIYFCSSGVKISINNNTNIVINELKILYTGGSILVPKLGAKEYKEFIVKPSSESHLEIEFKDFEKERYICIVGVYFEKDYSGYLSIKLESFEKITWEDNIKTSAFLSCCDKSSPRIGSSKISIIEK